MADSVALSDSDILWLERKEITVSASEAMKSIAEILERSRENGPMRDAPLAFVVALANAVADATIDFVIQDPDNADARARDGFEALWRAIA